MIQTQADAAMPGSTEPMKPVKVKTVQVKAGPLKLASGTPQPARPITSAIRPARAEVPETSSAIVAKAEPTKADDCQARHRKDRLPPQPAGHGTGNGILGVLPASSLPPVRLAGDGLRRPAPRPAAAAGHQQNGAASRSPAHTGWIIQVGALESESEAQQRIDAARTQARGLLSKADPFTETVWPRATRSCSAPVSPASSAIRPRPSARR